MRVVHGSEDSSSLRAAMKALDVSSARGWEPACTRSRPPTHTPEADPPPKRDEKGYEYTVQSGDSLSLIVEAYKQQGVKTSISEILKANPGLNPNRLLPKQKIFIPAPKP